MAARTNTGVLFAHATGYELVKGWVAEGNNKGSRLTRQKRLLISDESFEGPQSPHQREAVNDTGGSGCVRRRGSWKGKNMRRPTHGSTRDN